MKKFAALVLSLMLVLTLVGCASETTNDTTTNTADVKSEGVMTYAEYAAAELDSEVVIEAYVQATQSWWED